MSTPHEPDHPLVSEFGEELSFRPDGCPHCGADFVSVYTNKCWKCKQIIEPLVSLVEPKSDVIELTDLLDSIAVSSDGFMDMEYSVSELVHKGQSSDPTSESDSSVLAAAYDGIRYRITFTSGRFNFEPNLLLPHETIPVAVESQTDDVVRAWVSLRSRCSSAVWRSRFGHLIILSKKVLDPSGRRPLAADVIDEYLDLSSTFGHEFDSLDVQRAALSLARQFNLVEQRRRVLDVLTERARNELREPAPRPGIVLRITRALIDDKSSVDIDELLKLARSVYVRDPHQGDAVYEQQLERATTDESRSILWSERVSHWLNVADEAPGPQRAFFLTKAVEHATSSQDSSLVQRATARLQTVTIESLQMEGFRTGILHRETEIAQVVRPVVDAAGWAEAFTEFAFLAPPTGDAGANRATVTKQRDEFVFSTLLRSVRHGGDGLPRFTATTDEEQFEYDLVQNEIHTLQLRGLVITEGLLRLQIVHGLPPDPELQMLFMQSPTVDSALANALARAFYRWWAGDYEGAALTIMPRIEKLARDLLRSLDHGIYRIERDNRPGQYPGLGVLLSKLQQLNVVPENWYRYLLVLLVSQAGLNLRNEVSHGFVDNIDITVSALLLHSAAFLAFLPLRITVVEQPDTPSGSDDDASAVG